MKSSIFKRTVRSAIISPCEWVHSMGFSGIVKMANLGSANFFSDKMSSTDVPG